MIALVEMILPYLQKKKKKYIQTNNSVQNMSTFWYLKKHDKLVSSNRVSKIKIW